MTASEWLGFAVFLLLAVPVCLWVIAIAFAMISDVAGSIFSALQASLWTIYKRMRGEDE